MTLGARGTQLKHSNSESLCPLYLPFPSLPSLLSLFPSFCPLLSALPLTLFTEFYLGHSERMESPNCLLWTALSSLPQRGFPVAFPVSPAPSPRICAVAPSRQNHPSLNVTNKFHPVVVTASPRKPCHRLRPQRYSHPAGDSWGHCYH